MKYDVCYAEYDQVKYDVCYAEYDQVKYDVCYAEYDQVKYDVCYAEYDQVKADAPSLWCSTCAIYAGVGIQEMLWSHIGVVMHLLAAEPLSTPGFLFFPQCNYLADPVFDGVGLAGFKSRANVFSSA